MNVSPSLNIWFANIFSSSVSCHFILWMVSLAVKTSLVWCSLTCSFLLLLPLIFVSNPQNKNYCQDQCQRASYLFSSRSCMVFELIFMSLIHFEIIFHVRCKIVFHFLFFLLLFWGGGFLLCPTIFIKETILSALYILDTFVVH